MHPALSRVLLILWLKSIRRRFTSRIMDHLTVALCTAVLSAVALYMSSDFIGNRLALFRQSWQQEVRLGFCFFLSALLALMQVQMIRAERLRKKQLHAGGAGVPISFWSQRMGEHRGAIRSYLWQRGICITLAMGLGGGWVIHSVFHPNSILWLMVHSTLCCLAGLVGGMLYQMSLLAARSTSPIKTSPPQHLRIHWKMRLLLRLYPPAAHLMKLAGFSVCALFFVALRGHILELFALAFFAGLTASMALCWEEAEALRTGTYEKIAGTSHHHYLQSLSGVCGIVSAGLFLLAAMALFLAQEVNSGPWDAYLVHFCCIAALPPLLVPCMIFQVDARRPALNTLMIALSALFLATGILAHLLTLALIPVVIYITFYYQMNRYYRS